MARKTKEEALKTRELLLDAAIEIFSTKGVSRTTLADIAKQANMTRGAVYWHFENKDAVLEALWEKLLEPFESMNRVQEVVNAPDPLGELKRKYQSFFQILKSTPGLLQLFQILDTKCESVEENGTIHRLKIECHLEEVQSVETVLSKAIKLGQLPENFDVRLGKLAIFSFIDGLLNSLVLLPGLLEIDRDIPLLLDVIFGSLQSDFFSTAAPVSPSPPGQTGP